MGAALSLQIEGTSLLINEEHTMNNYQRLTQYLEQYPTDKKRLSFGEIEQIIGEELAPGAYQNLEWWDETTTVTSAQANAWLAAGWHIDDVDLAERWVKLRRIQRPAQTG
jgi:hypothetical protein